MMSFLESSEKSSSSYPVGELDYIVLSTINILSTRTRVTDKICHPCVELSSNEIFSIYYFVHSIRPSDADAAAAVVTYA